MSYGQFCSVARAQDALGGRWTLLIVRELLGGARRFNDIRRGIPRISRTMLSARLTALVELGVVRRTTGPRGPEYGLAEAGRELGDVIMTLGTWGQRWLPRQASREDLDPEPLLVDLERRVRAAALPRDPLVVRFEFTGQRPRFVLLRRSESAVCTHNPGFPEPITVRGPLAAAVAWWRGDVGLAEARRLGLRIEGTRAMVAAFPTWFDRYVLASVPPVRGRSGLRTPRTGD